MYSYSIAMHFTHTSPPLESTNGGCYTCAHWHGERRSGFPVCRYNKQIPIVDANPDTTRCAFWMREIGADDGPIEPTHLQSRYDVPGTPRT